MSEINKIDAAQIKHCDYKLPKTVRIQATEKLHNFETAQKCIS